jgi:hypothetical protein
MVALDVIKETTYRQLKTLIDREDEKHCVLSVNANGYFIHFLLTAIDNSWQVPVVVAEKGKNGVLHSVDIIDELLVRKIAKIVILCLDCQVEQVLTLRALIGRRFTILDERRNVNKIEDFYFTIEGQKVEVIFDSLHQFRNICKQMLSLKGVPGVNKNLFSSVGVNPVALDINQYIPSNCSEAVCKMWLFENAENLTDAKMKEIIVQLSKYFKMVISEEPFPPQHIFEEFEKILEIEFSQYGRRSMIHNMHAWNRLASSKFISKLCPIVATTKFVEQFGQTSNAENFKFLSQIITEPGVLKINSTLNKFGKLKIKKISRRS